MFRFCEGIKFHPFQLESDAAIYMVLHVEYAIIIIIKTFVQWFTSAIKPNQRHHQWWKYSE